MYKTRKAIVTLALSVAAARALFAQAPSAGAGLPDLRIRDWWVRPDAKPASSGNEVTAYKPYYVCFTVVNTGTAPSGAFTVGGGGLGIAYNPTQAHAGLAPGASRVGCLYYPTTPAPGTYYLGIKADYYNAVAESNEANNERVEAITVLP